MRLLFFLPVLFAFVMLKRVGALDSGLGSGLGSELSAREPLPAPDDELIDMLEPESSPVEGVNEDGTTEPAPGPDEGEKSSLEDTDDNNGPELEGPPDERRAFSSLTGVYERGVCNYGWSSCRNNPRKCCPKGGDCCYGRKCCPKGAWCYARAPCCKREHYGCDKKGCCPYGWQCCNGGKCCKPGHYCVIIKGKRGCCPWGKRCRRRGHY